MRSTSTQAKEATPTSVWNLVYGRFLEPEPRKAFFEAYKDIEILWEILSPAKELVDHIGTYKRLTQLYATVRNAYAEKIGFVADLAYKTRQVVDLIMANVLRMTTRDPKRLRQRVETLGGQAQGSAARRADSSDDPQVGIVLDRGHDNARG